MARSKGIEAERNERTAMSDNGKSATSDILIRLERLEDSFLTGLQDIRAVKSEIQKRVESTPDLENLLEADDIARILGVDVGYVYSQARANKMPSIKLGKYRKFSPSQLKKWLDRKNST
jgi:excisionase family DNA binding protein